MTERPVIFGADSVKAILADRKTQTRRVCTHRYGIEFLWGHGDQDDPSCWGYAFDGPDHSGYMVLARGLNERHDNGNISLPCPYGAPGDRLWVRETWAARPRFIDGVARSEVVYAATPRIGIRTPGVIRDVDHMCYLADETPLERHGFGWPIKWRSPIFMRREFARLTLEITDIRVQRLQSISDEDARAEGQGITWGGGCFHRSFAGGWDSLNAKRGHGWSTNPWVWAVTFRRLG